MKRIAFITAKKVIFGELYLAHYRLITNIIPVLKVLKIVLFNEITHINMI